MTTTKLIGDTPTTAINGETVKAGKLTLHRTPRGMVWFIDHRGIKRSFDDPHLGEALFETAKAGSGEQAETKTEAGSRRSPNLHIRASGYFSPPM